MTEPTRRQFLKGMGGAGLAVAASAVEGGADTSLPGLTPEYASWGALFDLVRQDVPDYMATLYEMDQPPWLFLPETGYTMDDLFEHKVEKRDGQYCYNGYCFDAEQVMIGSGTWINVADAAHESLEEGTPAFSRIGIKDNFYTANYFVDAFLPHPDDDVWMKAVLSDPFVRHTITDVYNYGQMPKEEAHEFLQEQQQRWERDRSQSHSVTHKSLC